MLLLNVHLYLILFITVSLRYKLWLHAWYNFAVPGLEYKLVYLLLPDEAKLRDFSIAKIQFLAYMER